MRTTLNINIPAPCHEDWNEMTPQQQGRHCASCEKTVFDFTSRTDEQIIKTYQTQNNLCGRFKTSQLDRELVLSRKEKNNYLSYVASTLFAFLSFNSMETEAQEPLKVIKTDSINHNSIKGKVAISILQDKTISGIITSKSDGSPLPFINVLVHGTKNGTITDFDGNFTLKAKKGDILDISYLGYDFQNIVITNDIKYDIKMTETDIQIMGEVILHDPKIEKTHNKNDNQNFEIKERSATGQLLYNMTSIFRRKN